ncbi:uncharacterized protein LOC125649759 [Ostrea edulis]|uniref:uncharacterized protein LOC125649759 n=1 Tax=Ostrea edulis TaxID=37623 RepID=UPI0024AF9796|nr:uncharacterized protein LOC125649759 [Ostrea edulis]
MYGFGKFVCQQTSAPLGRGCSIGVIKGAYICKHMNHYKYCSIFCKLISFIADINSLDVLAMAAEKRKLEEVIISLREENNKLKCEQMHLQGSLSNKSSMRYDNLKTEEFKYYTGFSSATFNVIYQFLVPVDEPFEYSKNVSSLRILSMKDQLLFVLIKLRQNFDFKQMSRLFGISPQDCSVIFSNWINFMFYHFGSVPIWPDRSIIIDKMPQKFKEEFPTTLVIIDGAEVKIQKPSSLTKQSQFYSDYKFSTNLKGLVGIDPRGSIIFASMLFSGSISDNDITHQSGFFKILKEMIKEGRIHEGDGVMAEKGFRIENDLEKIGLKLNMPPFAPASGQMKTSEVKMTEKVAIHRVHVERAIARVKKFKIMDNRIDLSLFSAINQIWFVCCFLTNFMPFLIQD